MPGSNCSTRRPATASRGFSAQRRIASTSLTWAASRNLRPPYLTKGILRLPSSISRRALWWEELCGGGGANHPRLPAQRDARLAVLKHAVGDIFGLSRLVLDIGQER